MKDNPSRSRIFNLSPNHLINPSQSELSGQHKLEKRLPPSVDSLFRHSWNVHLHWATGRWRQRTGWHHKRQNKEGVRGYRKHRHVFNDDLQHDYCASSQSQLTNLVTNWITCPSLQVFFQYQFVICDITQTKSMNSSMIQTRAINSTHTQTHTVSTLTAAMAPAEHTHRFTDQDLYQ